MSTNEGANNMDKKDFTRKNAVFLTWEKVSESCLEALRVILNRDIQVCATSDEPHFREWYLLLTIESRMNRTEIKTVLDTVEADDYEYDANDFGEYPVCELTSSVAVKLLNRTLGLNVEESTPVDEGVWLFEKADSTVYRILIEYPETDCRPDILEVATLENKEEVNRVLEDVFLNLCHLTEEIEVDRLNQFDMLVEALRNKLQAEIKIRKIDWVEKVM